MSTIFAKIISGDLPAKKIYETERILVIEDIDPQAPVHLLLISKKGYLSLHDIPKQELTILQEMGEVAQMLAEQFGIAKIIGF